MIGFWRRIGIALGLIEPTWIERWILTLRGLGSRGWQGKVVSSYRSPEDQVILEQLHELRSSQPSIFDWTEECPADFPQRAFLPIVGGGRGEVLGLEALQARPRYQR